MKFNVIGEDGQTQPWRVEGVEGATCFVAVFTGPDAELRAREYADFKNLATWPSADGMPEDGTLPPQGPERARLKRKIEAEAPVRRAVQRGSDIMRDFIRATEEAFHYFDEPGAYHALRLMAGAAESHSRRLTAEITDNKRYMGFPGDEADAKAALERQARFYDELNRYLQVAWRTVEERFFDLV